MNNEKFTERFIEVINESQMSIGRCVCLELTNNGAVFTGLSTSRVNSQHALVVIRKDGKMYAKGHFDGEAFETSSIDVLDSTVSLLIGIDLRKEGKKILYYKCGKTYGRLSPDTQLNTHDAMYVFWEYGFDVHLIIAAYDPQYDAVIVEIASSREKPMQTYLKAVVRQLLSLANIRTEEKNFDDEPHLDLDDFREEEVDHDSWYNENDYR